MAKKPELLALNQKLEAGEIVEFTSPEIRNTTIFLRKIEGGRINIGTGTKDNIALIGYTVREGYNGWARYLPSGKPVLLFPQNLKYPRKKSHHSNPLQAAIALTKTQLNIYPPKKK